MSAGLQRDPLFVALTRPQTFAGVTYAFFIANGVVTTELFLIFRTPWVLLFALLGHLAGVLACLRDPRLFDIWIVRLRCCPRVRNYWFWQCNSYRA